MRYMYRNPSTGLPTIDAGGNMIGSDDYTGVGDYDFSYPRRKETQEEADLNEFGAYLMLVLATGLGIYAYWADIIQFFRF